MIKALREGNRITIQGHAGQDELGKDIVCAAASILLYSMAETLQGYTHIMRDLNIDIQYGMATAEVFPATGHEETCTAILDTVWNGYCHLAQTYPDYVRVERSYI